ncbi:MAG: hypothetical protein RL563_1812 [Pseudomonadota bacterium]|jgi:tetratricopeptide (TPR) repeat protein
MSILDSFKKRSTLDAAIKQIAKARKSEAGKAEQLYKGAYQGFANVLHGNLLFSEALYHWGFGLLHEARTKPLEQAGEVYENAIAKFSFCLLTNPDFLGAAIDGGVAFMELARISAEHEKDGLYQLAEEFFEKACEIQKGSAAYNLACVYSLRGDLDNCYGALQQAKEFGSLPEVQAILNDDDLSNAKPQAWFKDFIEALQAQPDTVREKIVDADINIEPNFKLRKTEDFDYYS